jgi:hypothetical protein
MDLGPIEMGPNGVAHMNFNKVLEYATAAIL